MNEEELALQVVVEGFRRFMRQMDAMDRKIDGTGKEWKSLGGKSSRASGIMKTVGAGAFAAISIAAVAATAAIVAVGGAIALGVKTAISYESAFTGVIKTVDGVVDAQGELTATGQQLKNELRELATEIPVAFEELAGIAELGGQLGVATGDIVEFTDTIAKIGTATNLTADQAASSFAQIGNVMGSSQDDLTRFGDSVVSLGNNMATTESDIVNFSQRIAGAGAIAGLSISDIAGIGAAFSSVGIQAEAGGTAVQKVLLGINTAVVTGGEKLDEYAATAGMSADDFAAAWEDDAAGAFTNFVEGLGAAGDDAILMLQDLELGDQRLIRSFLSLAQSGDLLSESIDLSNQAFAEGTALTTEAATRFATTESQMQLLKNTFNEILAVIGEAFLPVFNELIGVVRDFVLENQDKLIPVFETIAGWLTDVVIPALSTLWVWFAENLPVAMEAVSAFWFDTLQPAFSSMQTEFQENIPVALETLTRIWEENLLPLFEQLGIFIGETLLPVLTTLWIFFIEQLVPIIAQIAEVYLVTMIDMWTWLFTVINENVIPTLIDLYDFFVANILPVLEDFAAFIMDDVMPALDAMWAFIDENLIPVSTALTDVITNLIELALKIMVNWWKNEILPVLKDVWKFLNDDMLPIWIALESFFVGNLFGTMETAEEKFDKITKALNWVRDAAQSLTTWLGNIAAALANISIPDQLQSNSPPKFAVGLRDISAATRELATKELPKLEARFASMNTTTPAIASSNVSNTTVSSSLEQNFNLTTQSLLPQGALGMEFETMSMANR